MNSLVLFVFYCHFIRILYSLHWPHSDDLALRVTTKEIRDQSQIGGRRDGDIHVDFYVPTDSKEETVGSRILVVKYQQPDGKHITEIYDPDNRIHLMKIILLGEVASGQPPFQHVCSITKRGETNILPAESFLRLRQKNPLSVRIAEEEMKPETLLFTSFLPLSRIPYYWSAVTSKYCGDGGGLYVTEEVYNELGLQNDTAAIRHSNTSLPQCPQSGASNQPCQCTIKNVLPWYPCGWKYCDDKTTGYKNGSSYRCGVRSCRVSRSLRLNTIVHKWILCDKEESTVDVD